jgi:hypothetical protein
MPKSLAARDLFNKGSQLRQPRSRDANRKQNNRHFRAAKESAKRQLSAQGQAPDMSFTSSPKWKHQQSGED